MHFPVDPAERDAWIIRQRVQRELLDPDKPYAFLLEDERFANGDIGRVATVFLTNKECPWHCTMCDLWGNTLSQAVPVGAIPRQIVYALSHLGAARQIKLYNSGSFFDLQAIPLLDYPAIAALLSPFERVIVESHPALIGRQCFDFQRQVRGQLEVAMGLETAHPAVLERLNKKMTLSQYADAADLLSHNRVSLRSFVLIQPPFMSPEESLYWACRSIDFALECGAVVVTLIPTRAGNGAMEQLAIAGQFTPPNLSTIELALDYGISLTRCRIFVDLWDISRISAPVCCRDERIDRMRQMNLAQVMLPCVECDRCANSQ